MTYISVRKAKQYYRSFKNVMHKQPSGTTPLFLGTVHSSRNKPNFGGATGTDKALEVSKPKKQQVLKGGLKIMKTDIELPLEHRLYGKFVYDTKEKQWYNKLSDMYIDEEERILYKLPTYEELLAEKKKT